MTQANPPVHDRDADEEAHPSAHASLGTEQNPEILPGTEPWRGILHAIGVAEQVAGSVLLLVVFVLVLAQVALRYLPIATVPWTGEIARLAMVWLTFVMAGYLAAHDRHIAIQVVDYVLRGRALGAVKLFVDLVVLATCVVAMVAIAQLLAEDIGQVTPAAELPLWIVNFVPLIGFALTALRVVVVMLVRDLPVVIGRGETGP
jgi:TRAP-type C4-dicarboxylate transport system permease small subunit